MNAAEKELPARVIASHGRRVVVETPAGERVACAIQGRQLQVYCGDDVHWRRDGATDRGIVTDQLPRRSVLERTNATGRAEIIAANLTQLVVVIAAEPVPDWFIVDRFLAAAELSRLAALVVCNKADLPTPPQMQEELQNYRVVGYDVIECSNPHGTGIELLSGRLSGHVSVLVGQSGVGKSSLANSLVPGLQAATAELSAATEEGRHVTSVSTLHHLPAGGDLVDSPGVRDYAPAVERIVDPAAAFREFLVPAQHCRFADCRHLREPDCGVHAAVEAGQISARRYESFKRLSRLRERLAPPPGGRTRRH